jgi:AbrB family looped-hinge helix DNA binding protein
MQKAKLTSKGQITIPKEVRKQLGLRIGDEIEFVKENGHFRLQKVFTESPFDKWVGFLKEWEGYDVDEMIEEMRGR